ncbi:MAG: RNA repair domain-containing protein [Candidatus Nezhaarchaeota archaeon]|nr:RNA repair domain-containing protein [Candidatus Nezhaarchaeota archaeon]MCX8141948.1 RNA repair domain-containing protein [Candidatus Nezhaarchaeota archaeon]MDW8050271.1 RNA repair domain-containing protein [Nitrososphaerota archaeon]
MGSRIRFILNKIKWHGGLNLEDYEVHILHRGAPSNVKIITGSEITGIFKDAFTYRNPKGIEEVIPYHRVLLIRDKIRNVILFSKRS